MLRLLATVRFTPVEGLSQETLPNFAMAVGVDGDQVSCTVMSAEAANVPVDPAEGHAVRVEMPDGDDYETRLFEGAWFDLLIDGKVIANGQVLDIPI